MVEDRELTLGQLAAKFGLPITDEHHPRPHVHITPLWKAFIGDEKCNTQHITIDHLHFPIFGTYNDSWTLFFFGVLSPTSVKNRRFI